VNVDDCTRHVLVGNGYGNLDTCNTVHWTLVDELLYAVERLMLSEFDLVQCKILEPYPKT
jgi:hypothetical protein